MLDDKKLKIVTFFLPVKAVFPGSGRTLAVSTAKGAAGVFPHRALSSCHSRLSDPLSRFSAAAVRLS